MADLIVKQPASRNLLRLIIGMNIPQESVVLVFVLLFSLFGVTVASGAGWRNHTNVNQAIDLYPIGDTVWAATSGGLAMFADINVEVITNADGLGDNDLLFVTSDASGRLWTGGHGGRLSSFDPSTGEWKFFDFEDQDGRPLSLNAAVANGDFLWVGSKIGVHKFDMVHYGGEIKETYRRLGDLPGDEEVRDILLAGEYIWVATGAGCAVARTDDINLQDYSHWRSFSADNSDLQHHNVASLAEVDGIILAATEVGLYSFVVNGADSIWSRVPGPEMIFRDLFGEPESLWGATNLGLAAVTSEGYSLITSSGMASRSSRAVCRDGNGMVWVSTNNGSGYAIYDGAAWSNMTVAGIASNMVNDVAIGPGGNAWAVHPNGKPISKWDGSAWSQVVDSVYTGAPTVNALAVDHEGFIWTGGHGTGAIRFNPADPNNDFQRFDENNSPLRGTEPPPNDWYVVVYDITVDDSGRVWLANTFDYEDRIVVFYDHGCWGYFGLGDGFPSVEPISVFAVPKENELLFGLNISGLADLEWTPGGPLCANGVQLPHATTVTIKDESDGLPSMQVRCSLVDAARTVWVGTSGGLAYFDNVFNKFRKFAIGDTPSPTINALLADGGNNIWVGTEEGLFMIAPNGEVTSYRPDNSGLADLTVTSLAVEDETNTLWIGTAGGISEFIGAVADATPVEDIVAYPNPFVITRGDEILRFDAAFGTSIKIFNVAGEMVADIGTAGEWDGRNDAGSLVAGGVYLFVASDTEGKFGRGKFAVLRQ